MAPFLQDQAGLSEGLVGTALASQWLIMAFTGSMGGTLADRLENSYPGAGRATVIQVGVAMGTLCYLAHGLHLAFRPDSTAFSIFQSFTWHLVMRLIFATSNALTAPVLDGLTIAYLEQQENHPSGEGMGKADFGKERLFGAISWAVGNLISGVLVDAFGFSALYWLALAAGVVSYAVLEVFKLTMVAEQRLESEARHIRAQESARQARGEMAHLLKKKCSDDETMFENGDHNQDGAYMTTGDVLASIFSTIYGFGFVFSFLTLSMGTNIVEGLIFTWFRELGASNTFCGFTVALTVVFEIPLFHWSPSLLVKYGPGILQAVAGLAYVTRVVGYSIVPQGQVYYVMLLEPLHGMTYALSMTSAVDFMAQRLPSEQAAAGQGWVWTGRSIGAVVGLLGGSWTQQMFGGRIMYRIFAGIVALGMTVYGIANRLTHAKALKSSESIEIEPTNIQNVDAQNMDGD